ncbi:MAG: translation initiation factor IF-2 [Candidatus Nanohaloarchaea archaeon]|nr:translation initiation factor IF-2 [Candidatus Nanohaloarchaea archaeon]
MTEDRKLRQPIVSVLGHVDSGKTTLLDHIRQSTVAQKEAGSITQMIGATEVPTNTIETFCGDLLDQLDTELTIPGLLFIDTPGHAAFTSLRKRGGSLSDLAILVVDIQDGVQPQTEEAIQILKESETPFVIALNKIDTLPGWQSEQNACWKQNLASQRSKLQKQLNEKIYEIMGELHDQGITCERYDRVDSFQQKVAVVPCSAETGEGIPDLMMVMAGLSQRYLDDDLKVVGGTGQGTVLEVNEVKGFGTTIDVILYDGILKKDDKLIVGGKNGVIVRDIKAILKTQPLTEMRREKDFDKLEEAVPAAGVKIAAQDLDDVMAGAPVRAVRSGDEEALDEARQAVREELKDFDIQTLPEGVVVKADSLGSLEAVSKTFADEDIPIAKAEVGKITKQDILELEGSDPEHKVVFGFNTGTTGATDDMLTQRDDVKVFTSDIIYELVDRYKGWRQEVERRQREKALSKVARPGRFRIMPDHVFRASNPAVVGVEILEGAVSPGSKFMTDDGEVLGRIKSVQEDGESIDLATKGDEVALSLTNVQVGRQVVEGESFYTDIPSNDYRALQELEEHLSQDELNVLEKIVDIKDQKDPRWKLS